MTVEAAIKNLKESRRQNQVMLDNPTLFFLKDPAKRLVQIQNAKERIDALTIAIKALGGE